MPEPVTMAALYAGAVVLGAIVNWWNGDEGRKADDEKRTKIKAIFDKIKPPDYDLTLNDPPELHKEALANPQYAKDLAKTVFSKDVIKDLGKFIPETIKMIREEDPLLLSDSKAGKRYRKSAEAALEEFDRIRKTGGMDARFRSLIERAKRNLRQEQQARSATSQQQMARRGMADSGAALISQLHQGQAGSDRMAEMEERAAGDAYRNRLQAIASGGELGSKLRGQELDIAQHNTGLINDFNRRMSAREMAVQQSNVNLRNQANMEHLLRQQQIQRDNITLGDKRAMISAQEDRMNTLRQDALADKNWERQWKNLAREDRNAIIAAEWDRQEKARQNYLRSKQYHDQMSHGRASAGLSAMEAHDRKQAAANTAGLWQGLIGGATGAMGAYNAADRQAKMDDRWDKQFSMMSDLYGSRGSAKPAGGGGSNFNLGVDYSGLNNFASGSYGDEMAESAWLRGRKRKRGRA
tara:strand:+ start:13817 stop:15217 length:1401 start_codon:yes stop_codon:yes gene_type:complete